MLKFLKDINKAAVNLISTIYNLIINDVKTKIMMLVVNNNRQVFEFSIKYNNNECYSYSVADEAKQEKNTNDVIQIPIHRKAY